MRSSHSRTTPSGVASGRLRAHPDSRRTSPSTAAAQIRAARCACAPWLITPKPIVRCRRRANAVWAWPRVLTSGATSVKTAPSMNKRTTLAFAVALSATVLAGNPGALRAQAPPNVVVVKVGNMSLSGADVERKMSKVPRFQLSALADTPEGVKRAFVEKSLIPGMLLAQGARAKHIEDQPEVREQLRAVLRSALMRSIREDTEKNKPVTDDEVSAYYLSHKDEFNTSARYSVWRILVPTQQDAADIISKTKKDTNMNTWGDICRNRSTDNATKMRGGNLGFVTDDGMSTDARVKLDPAEMEAIRTAKDGDVIDHPVPEGKAFAVIWRRGSLPAVRRALPEAAENIRAQLLRDRVRAAQDKLVDDLKSSHLKEMNTTPLGLLEITSDGHIRPTTRPGRVERKPAGGPPGKTPAGPR